MKLGLGALGATLLFAACTESSPRSSTGRQSTPPPPSGTDEQATDASETPSPAKASPGERGHGLIYLKGRAIRRFDAASGNDALVLRVPTRDVFAAPGGARIAYVAPARESREGEDFTELPELHILDLATGEDVLIGPGLSPHWSPAGDALAYLVPVDDRDCDGEACDGDVEVARVAAGDPDRMLGAGRWGLLGWAGTGLLVADLDRLRSSLLVERDGRRSRLPVPVNELWGASPNGRFLVTSTRRGSATVMLTGAVTAGDPLRLRGGVLAEGAWAPDSSRVAAVVLEAGSGGLPGSRVVTFRPRQQRPATVPGSDGATGPVLWDPAATAFAFSRATGGSGGRLEAVVCDSVPRLRCRALFSWGEGIVPLALD